MISFQEFETLHLKDVRTHFYVHSVPDLKSLKITPRARTTLVEWFYYYTVPEGVPQDVRQVYTELVRSAATQAARPGCGFRVLKHSIQISVPVVDVGSVVFYGVRQMLAPVWRSVKQTYAAVAELIPSGTA